MAVEDIYKYHKWNYSKTVGRHKYLIQVIKIKYFNHERISILYFNLANIW